MATFIEPVKTGWLPRMQVPLQVSLYVGLFIFSQYLVAWLHLPLPANIVGMLLLLAMIMLHIVPLRWGKAGANWLLAEMLLCFIPAVVAVVNYSELLRVEGWRILLVITVSTLLVLATTSLVVDRVSRFELWLAARKQQRRGDA